jgi:hypothetical protein
MLPTPSASLRRFATQAPNFKQLRRSSARIREACVRTVYMLRHAPNRFAMRLGFDEGNVGLDGRLDWRVCLVGWISACRRGLHRRRELALAPADHLVYKSSRQPCSL